MDSIVKPLVTQVNAVNKNYDQVVQALAQGKPEGKQMLRGLARSARQLFANFKEKSALLKAGLTQSPGFVPNIGIMIKMLIYYVQEIIAFVQLFVGLMSLLANILSLKTIIDWFVADLKKAQQYLQKKMLLMESTVNRIKQKVQKNLEWIKRTVTIKINEIFTKAQIQYYQKQLETAKNGAAAAQSSATAAQAIPTSSLAAGSSYSAPLGGGVVSTGLATGTSLSSLSLRSTTPLDANSRAFLPDGSYPPKDELLKMYPNPMDSLSDARVAYDAAREAATNATIAPVNSNTSGGVSNNLFGSAMNNTAQISSDIALQEKASTAKAIVAVLQTKVDSLNKEMASYAVQRQAIEDDKTTWNQKWSKEAAEDQAALANDTPKIGANHSV